MELLSDPCEDRQIPTVKPPPHRPLHPNLMYPNQGKDFVRINKTDLRM